MLRATVLVDLLRFLLIQYSSQKHGLTLQADAQEPPANPCPSLLPSMHEILPPQAATSQTAAKDVRALAGKLLGQVSAIEPAWHARATMQQPACA